MTTAIADLDALLGDLEESCNSKSSPSSTAAAATASGQASLTTQTTTSSSSSRTTPTARVAPPSSTTHTSSLTPSGNGNVPPPPPTHPSLSRKRAEISHPDKEFAGRTGLPTGDGAKMAPILLENEHHVHHQSHFSSNSTDEEEIDVDVVGRKYNNGVDIDHEVIGAAEVKDLDLLLEDLSLAKYSYNNYEATGNTSTTKTVYPEKTRETEAVIREMETSSKLIERRLENRSLITEGATLDESKWEYLGCGIWENSVEPEVRGVGSAYPVSKIPTESPKLVDKHVQITTTAKTFSTNITTTTSGGAGNRNRNNNANKVPAILHSSMVTEDFVANDDRNDHADQEMTSPNGHEMVVNNRSGHQVTSRTTMSKTEISASSATQELDQLMNSLNSFQSSSVKKEESVDTTLDEMLGDLREDMSKQGVKTTQKGVCAACAKPIVGQVITALGRTWHPEHFTCSHCSQELATQNFFERDGRSYCESDYHRLFSPRCAGCQEAILNKCVSALDVTWHPECFACADCSTAFGDDGFHDRDGKAFCKPCFFRIFAPKCGGCTLAIEDSYISSLDRQWHANCFVCATCREPFTLGNFFEHDGVPYCETHYHALRGSLCSGCQKPISGRCITAMFKKFHPEHFVCSFCLKQLNKGTFKERSEKPYCHECHDRLFG